MSRRRGSALLVSMVFVVLVAGMGVCMIQIHTGQTRRQEQALDNKRALYVAEAGLAEAFMSISTGKTGNVGTAEVPAAYGDGLYWVEASEQGQGRVALRSTGLCGKGRFSVAAVLQRQVDPVASLGIYAVDGVVAGEGVLVDGYYSAKSDFASQVDDSLGDGSTGKGALLASGADVVLEGDPSLLGLDLELLGLDGTGSKIYGDVRPGPAGVVDLGGGVSVSGSTAPAKEAALLPEITVPAHRVLADPSFAARALRVPGGRYDFSNVSIPAGFTLSLQGPASIVTDQLLLSSGGTLIVDSTQGQVVVYVTERLSMEPGSSVTSVQADPSGFVLMVTADQWQDFDSDGIADDPALLAPDGELYGFVYAPTVDLSLQANTHLLGGVAAKSLVLQDGARMTFDWSLKSSQMASAGLPLLVAWRISDLPDAPIMTRARDPRRTLSDGGVTPVRSADAALDDHIQVDYFKSDGTLGTYSGPASGMDWTLVDQVIGVLWDDDAVLGDEGRVPQVPVSLTRKAILSRDTSGKADAR